MRVQGQPDHAVAGAVLRLRVRLGRTEWTRALRPFRPRTRGCPASRLPPTGSATRTARAGGCGRSRGGQRGRRRGRPPAERLRGCPRALRYWSISARASRRQNADARDRPRTTKRPSKSAGLRYNPAQLKIAVPPVRVRVSPSPQSGGFYRLVGKADRARSHVADLDGEDSSGAQTPVGHDRNERCRIELVACQQVAAIASRHKLNLRQDSCPPGSRLENAKRMVAPSSVRVARDQRPARLA
jgi:hypothetical protein